MKNIEITTGVVHEAPEGLLSKWNQLTALARNEWICWLTIVKKHETIEDHLIRLEEEINKGEKGLVAGLVAPIGESVQKSGLKI